MNYKYNQFLFKKSKSYNELIQFICYRPDLNVILYSIFGFDNREIHECDPKDIIETNYEDIYNFFENEINEKKTYLKERNKIMIQQKEKYKKDLKKTQCYNTRIKKTGLNLFKYKIISTVTDTKEYDTKIEVLIYMMNEAKRKKRDNKKYLETSLKEYIRHRNMKEKLEKVIGELREDRRIVLDSGNYIRSE